MRSWHVLMVAAMLVLGSGCSVKFAYNNLDRFARWGLSDYLSMNQEQRRYFDAEFAKLHDWHRSNHLPRYADMLESLPTLLVDGVDSQEMLALENTMFGWADEMEERGTPMAIELMRSMTDDQVAELPGRLAAGNDDVARPELNKSLDAAQANWGEEVLDVFSEFAGRPSADQRKYLKSQSIRYLPEWVLWADYRRRWQADLLPLLQQREEAAKFAEQFTQLAANREAYYGTELARIFEHNQALNREVGAWLLNNMTEAQQGRLFERLLGIAVELRELAAEADEFPSSAESCLLTC